MHAGMVNSRFLWAAIGCAFIQEVFAKILEQTTQEDKQKTAIVELLHRAREEHDYGYVLVFEGVKGIDDYGAHQEKCVFHECLRSIQLPVMVMRAGRMPKLNTYTLPKQVILVSCHYMGYNNDVLYNTELQMAPHIVLAEVETDVSAICAQLQRNEAYNAIVITKDFGQSKSYFVCELWPENMGQIRQKPFRWDEEVFEARFHNMAGHKLFTHPDQMLPRSFVYYGKGGKLEMDGYVGNILPTFAFRLNATLAYKLPIQPGVQTFFETLENGTREGYLDIATGLKPIDLNMDNISYPVEFMTYCYMIPLPSRVPVNKIFFMIVELRILFIIVFLMVLYSILIILASRPSHSEHLTFINVFCNDTSIRGLLGQSFVMPQSPRLLLKFICFLLCYTSVMLNTSYQAYLQSYLTQPPFQILVRSFDDMRSVGMKIIASTRELKYIDPRTVESYSDLFEFQANYTKYVEMRATMDNRFAYTVTSAMWHVFGEKQKYFKQPSFYYSTHLCLKDSFLVAMPIRPGLPYLALFNRHLLLLRDVGLMQHWTSTTFLTMLRFKMMDFIDLSADIDLEIKIVVDDLLWVWVLFVICSFVSVFAFLGEWFLRKVHQ